MARLRERILAAGNRAEHLAQSRPTQGQLRTARPYTAPAAPGTPRRRCSRQRAYAAHRYAVTGNAATARSYATAMRAGSPSAWPGSRLA